MKIPPKYIDTSGKHQIEDVTWILQEAESNDNKLVYFAYDANLFPCLMYSAWKETEFKDRQKIKVLEVLKDFQGEVWLDDVKITGGAVDARAYRYRQNQRVQLQGR